MQRPGTCLLGADKNGPRWLAMEQTLPLKASFPCCAGLLTATDRHCSLSCCCLQVLCAVTLAKTFLRSTKTSAFHPPPLLCSKAAPVLPLLPPPPPSPSLSRLPLFSSLESSPQPGILLALQSAPCCVWGSASRWHFTTSRRRSGSIPEAATW